METKAEKNQLWKCLKCGREFERHNQSHSCKSYPFDLHFERKETSKNLYKILCKEIKKNLGLFKIQSLECCIHFVSTFTFAAVKILKSKIKINFTLNRMIKSQRLIKSLKLSEHRFLYCVEIKKAEEIDNELIMWIKEALDRKMIFQE